MSYHSDLHLQLTAMSADPSEDPADRAAARRQLSDAGWDYHPTVSDWPRPRDACAT